MAPLARSWNASPSSVATIPRVERVRSATPKQKIERLIKDLRPDIAHIHGIAHETSPSILPVLKQADYPIVQTLHDYKLLCPNTNFTNRLGVCEACKGHRYYNVVRYRCKHESLAASLLAGIEMYTHKLLQIYENNVDLFITPSQFLKNKVHEYGIRNPVVQLPNFIDVEKIQPYSNPENYFVYCGRLVALKGIGLCWRPCVKLRPLTSTLLVQVA